MAARLVTYTFALARLALTHATTTQRGFLLQRDPQASLAAKPRSGATHNPNAYEGDPPPFRQELRNEGDAQYTGRITVGNQSLDAIIDTGSFDLVVFSEQCVECGEQAKLYSNRASQSYTPGNITATQSYGSGSTHSTEAYETVSVGTFTARRQAFWEVLDLHMPILRSSTFQAILGVGPPSSSLRMAEEEAAMARRDVMERENNGEDVTVYAPILKGLSDVAEHAKRSSVFAANVGVLTSSICLRREKGAPGVFIWNDNTPGDLHFLFTEVAVVGDTYWSAELRDVRLSPVPGGDEGVHAASLGCASDVCSAVMDTGTSLIVAPSAAVKHVSAMLREWSARGVNCTDVSSLPDLEFRIGGEAFSLPPESYVGEFSGRMHKDMKPLLPHVQDDYGPRCVALLMTLDVPSQFGALWVFGLPFFRKYYTSFRLKENKVDPMSMAFAPAGPDCNPVSGDAATLRQQQPDGSAWERRAPMKIRADKLRVPRWLGDASRLARLGEPGIRL